MKEFVWL